MSTLAVTPEDVRTRAVHRAARLGPPPITPRDLARWRDERDSAAVELAAAANWDAVLLSQALALMDGPDDDAKQLVFAARDYCPRRNR